MPVKDWNCVVDTSVEVILVYAVVVSPTRRVFCVVRFAAVNIFVISSSDTVRLDTRTRWDLNVLLVI